MTTKLSMNAVPSLGNIGDLTTPTSTPQYPLGFRFKIKESHGATGTEYMTEYIYIKATGALTAYVPLMMNYSGTDAAEITTTAIATSSVYREIVVPQVAFTSGYYCFVPIKGYCLVNPDTTPTAGHYGTAVNGTPTVAVDAASIAVTAFCVFLPTVAASATPCLLLGTRVTV